MVNKLAPGMGLTGNGLRDWLIQRFSSLIIGLYFIALSLFFFIHPTIDYSILRNSFSSIGMQIFTLITLISIFLHAWIGIWTVITDYVKPIAFRLIIQVVAITALVIYFFWGVVILWKLT